MNFTIEKYEQEETFQKTRKAPKQEGFIPKGKKYNKKDYSQQRDQKRNYE